MKLNTELIEEISNLSILELSNLFLNLKIRVNFNVQDYGSGIDTSRLCVLERDGTCYLMHVGSIPYYLENIATEDDVDYIREMIADMKCEN